jgi:hypothetical protein
VTGAGSLDRGRAAYKREDPVSRAYEEFYGSEKNRTCARCGHVTR